MPAVSGGRREVGIVERTGFDSGLRRRRFGSAHEVFASGIENGGDASVCRRGLSSLRGNRAVALGPAIAKELPYFADIRNHVQIEIRHDDFVFVPAGLGDNFAARIAEIALAIKLSNAPRFLDAYPVDAPTKIAVVPTVPGLFEFPQIFRDPSNPGRRIEHDLGSV